MYALATEVAVRWNAKRGGNPRATLAGGPVDRNVGHQWVHSRSALPVSMHCVVCSWCWFIVGQFFWRNANIVWSRSAREAPGHDVTMSEENGLCYTMHSVHHTPIGRQDDGVIEAAFVHQAHVLDDGATSRLFSIAKPVVFVKLRKSRDWHRLGSKRCRQSDQAMHVPGHQARRALAEVILTTHAREWDA